MMSGWTCSSNFSQLLTLNCRTSVFFSSKPATVTSYGGWGTASNVDVFCDVCMHGSISRVDVSSDV